jgi:protease I
VAACERAAPGLRTGVPRGHDDAGTRQIHGLHRCRGTGEDDREPRGCGGSADAQGAVRTEPVHRQDQLALGREARGAHLPYEDRQCGLEVLAQARPVLETHATAVVHERAGHAHGVRRVGTGDEQAGPGAAEQPLLQEAAQLGSGAHVHVGNRSAPGVCLVRAPGSRRPMAGELNGMKVAVLATDGVEQVELDRPWQALEEVGAEPELVSLEGGTITAYDHIDKGDIKKVDAVVSTADPDAYGALVLPGGVINGDFLRADSDAVAFVASFFEAGKPVAAICHAPWVLIEAGAVKGRRMTSWPSLQTDLRNAGAEWVDEEVVVDGNLITSRNPDDLDAFSAAIVEEFAREEEGE